MSAIENRVADEIVEFVKSRLMQEGGFCGVAEGGTSMVFLNGDDGKGTDIKVKVEIS